MKRIYFKYIWVCFLATIVIGCSKNDNTKPVDNNDSDTEQNPSDSTSQPSSPSDDDQKPTYKGVWSVDSISDGLVHYHFHEYYQSFAANENVNVLKLDLDNPKYKLKFVGIKTGLDSLSSVAGNYNAVAGINGSFGRSYSFVRVDGNDIFKISSYEPGPRKLHWWAYEGAFFYNDNQDLKIAYGTKSEYEQSSYQNISTGGAVLVDDYDPVGKTFIGDVSGINLNSLDYSDYRRIMGVRHPRTAYALTPDNHLLLITIDGRTNYSKGMSAKEVTEFITKYFDIQYAINMDGGGSTAMYIKGEGPNGIVNYPTDNGKVDHFGQRLHYSFLLIVKAD